MDKSWIYKPRLSEAYKLGVNSFLDFEFGKSNENMMKCPCNRCSLKNYKSREDIEGDLMCSGFLTSYTSWVLHGEDIGVSGSRTEITLENTSAQVELDSTFDLLDDLFPNTNTEGFGSFEQPMDSDRPSTSAGNHGTEEGFDELLADFNQELYTGCTKFTKLSFIWKLYHIKCICGISDKGITMVLDLLKEAFTHAKLPSSFSDMKKVIRKLGMTYESIHACPNDCMLYGGTNADRQDCKVCEESRWKLKTTDGSQDSGSKNKNQTPAKVFRYFPLKPRLQRLFMSKTTATDIRWHVTSSIDDGKLRHPRDGAAWKEFDIKYPEFASDPRNVRLGLATDGFNPFGTMSTSYSIWPVILFPYNLPPWMSMKHTSMILSMVIPGKHAPGNDIDIYLQPLINELKELWADGVKTFDASTKETFDMRATIMWTINNFPGLGNLSGWNTYTKQACPSCNYDSIGHRLKHGKKYCSMGHRRFLNIDHGYRQNRASFDGKTETRLPPVTPSGSTIRQQQEDVNVTLGKKQGLVGKKRERSNAENSNTHQWRKKSIFFELPNWEFNLLRHNLDVMHIEKNVFDNLVYTLMDDKNKSKDNISARQDLRELGIRSDLWPDDNGKYIPGSFTLDNDGKDMFLKVLKDVRLPDGYASNISNCVDLSNRKLSGLKSHDCHMIMRDLLSVAIQNLLPSYVTSAIVEVCRCFRAISAKVLDINELDNLQDRIVVTLCRLEMLFPPSFFTVMVHLIVQLTKEAKHGGPIPFRWMYPVERTLGHFKSYVRNRAKPEGSICEKYLADECITFCSTYLEDIETRFNRLGRVDDQPIHDSNTSSNTELTSIFQNLGRFVGAGKVHTLSYVERQQAHRHVPVNCQLLDHLREDYKKELLRKRSRQSKRSRVIDVDRELHLNFAKWFKQKVDKNDMEGITKDLRCLALGPSERVVKYTTYNVSGFKFRTVERDDDLKTQCSGVYVADETMSYASSRDLNPRSGDVAYFGKLLEVVELNYYETFKVVLLKCRWANTSTEQGYKKMHMVMNW